MRQNHDMHWALLGPTDVEPRHCTWQVWEVFAALPPKNAPYDFDYNGAGGTATLKEFSYRRRLQVWTILVALAPYIETHALLQAPRHTDVTVLTAYKACSAANRII